MGPLQPHECRQRLVPLAESRWYRESFRRTTVHPQERGGANKLLLQLGGHSGRDQRRHLRWA